MIKAFVLATVLAPVSAQAILPKHLAEIRCVVTYTEQLSRPASSRLRDRALDRRQDRRQDRRPMDEWRNGQPELDWYLELNNFYGFDVAMEPYRQHGSAVQSTPAVVTIRDHATGATTEMKTPWVASTESRRRFLQMSLSRPDTRSGRQQGITLECQRPLAL